MAIGRFGFTVVGLACLAPAVVQAQNHGVARLGTVG